MDDEFADVYAWLARMQRDPNELEKIDTRENIIREVVASLRMSGIEARREWIDHMWSKER